MIKFKSVLNPEKWGYEWTGDSMTFWDTSYRHGGVLHCSAGYYETYGDGTTQHTPLQACRQEQFTDFCVSFVRHLLDNPAQQDGVKGYLFHLSEVPVETIRFLATVRYKEDKRQWYTINERKVSGAEAKAHDKRWFEVPKDADGTIASAFDLYCLASNRAPRELLPMYAMHDHFWDTLYNVVSSGDRWDKITEYRERLSGDHRAAFTALKSILAGLDSMDTARRMISCAEHNSANKALAAA